MNHLAKNIRFLRKSRKWSQEELAAQLKVKRSSIAAYENKNVRPRLEFILALSRLFNVSLSDLVERDLEQYGGAAAKRKEITSAREDGRVAGEFAIRNDSGNFGQFMERSHRIRKMLEGFSVFYRIKLEHMPALSEDARRLTADIENFLLLMEHLLNYNEAVIRAVSRNAE